MRDHLETQFHLLDAFNCILPDKLRWWFAAHGPEQDWGSPFHDDVRWWGEERDAAAPVQISAADLGLLHSQRRGTRMSGVQLSSFVARISYMVKMSCSLYPIDCIDNISIKCRGSR